MVVTRFPLLVVLGMQYTCSPDRGRFHVKPVKNKAFNVSEELFFFKVLLRSDANAAYFTNLTKGSNNNLGGCLVMYWNMEFIL